jgi:hypothetical protein
MGTFSVGQIVHYVAEDGTHYAALVCALDGARADLAVFAVRTSEYWQQRGLDMQFHTGIVSGIGPGTWHCLVDCK